MNQSRFILFSIIAIFMILLINASVFTVSETEVALRKKFGEVVETNYSAGLHWKFPVIDNIIKFDRRVMTLDSEPERYLTSEKKNVIVDSFVKWRIDDVKKFYTSVGGNENQALTRLDQLVKKIMKEEFSKRSVTEVVSQERNDIMEVLNVKTNKNAMKELGVRIVDVRIKRVDLPSDVSNSVYRRMRAERERIAKDFRSRGAEASERIRASADKNRTVILAEAYRDSEKLKGDGDANSAEIYAKAYTKNKEFYSFYRSLDAYKNTFSSKSDIMVLQPDSEFFKYFKLKMGEAKK
ncbi:MAG: protease modulator HflC [Methylococcales bacterium]|jgi:membrane protease subunit HflC|nr:protease modulator HflC [Methylococcales bacterium]